MKAKLASNFEAWGTNIMMLNCVVHMVLFLTQNAGLHVDVTKLAYFQLTLTEFRANFVL